MTNHDIGKPIRRSAGPNRRTVLAGMAAGAGMLAAPPAIGQAKLKLTVWNFASQLQAAISETFAAANPDIELDYAQFSLNDLHEKLLVSLATGIDLPDIAALVVRRAPEFLASEAFMPIDDMLGDYKADFTPSGLIRHADRTYGYVIAMGNMGMWMNHAELANFGIDTATLETWPDFMEAAEKLKAETGGAKYMMARVRGRNGANYFNAFFNARGGNWWTETGEVNEDLSLAADTLEWFADRSRRGLALDIDWVQPAHYDALREKVLLGFGSNMAVGLNNIPKQVPDQSGDWRLVTWPKWSADAPKQTGNWGGIFFAATRNANSEAAERFMTWWLKEQGLRDQVSAMGLSGYLPSQDLPEMNKSYAYFGGQKVPLELSRVDYPAFNYFHWSDTEEAIANAVDQVVFGSNTADAAIAQVKGELARVAGR